MPKNYIGIFDVMGPAMIGPSSSHTSGAASIAWMARQVFSARPVKVTYTLYGSFAETYKGHGTDRALIGGMLGYRSNNARIRNAYEDAKNEGLTVDFFIDKKTEVSHPNTVDILMESEDGKSLLIRGESVGGGRVRIVRMNNIDVDFTGEFCTMIVSHLNKSGTIAYITTCLAEQKVNIANLRSFRADDGKTAITVVETEGFIPDDVVEKVTQYETVKDVDMIEL